MTRIDDVVIIGGGVCGCALARELAARNMSVTVIERDAVAAHASGKSWGGLYPASGAGIPGPVAVPAKRSFELHRQLYDELKEQSGIDYQLRPVESISLAMDEPEMSALEQEAARLRDSGFAAELLNADQVRELEPHVTPGVAGGLLQGTQMELDSYDFTRALARSARDLGTRFNYMRALAGSTRYLGTRFIVRNATKVKSSNGRVDGVVMDTGEYLPAGQVVVATGPWSGQSGLEGVPRFSIKPIKGEILRLRLPGPEFRYRVGHGGYNVGRKPDGLVWLGTTEWDMGYNDQPSEAGQWDILNGATSFVPAIRDGEIVEHTACLRPVTEDGFPIVGALQRTEGLWALAGAGKKGVLLSLALAEMLANAITDPSKGAPIPAPLSPARFGL